MSTPDARKVAVVTGGVKRLGGQLSQRMAARGYEVIAVYRSSADAAHALVDAIAAAGGTARALKLDVADKHAVAAAFAGIAGAEGRVDLLVNNVGNYNPQDVTALDPDVWDATIGANLSGAYYCCYGALGLMPDGGNIINIGMAGLEGIRANRRGTDYYVSKTGLLVLTRALAAACAERQIRVNMVSPGQLDNSVDLPPPDEITRWVPLGRSGTLDDIAQAVDYLLDAPYVTGVNIDVAGGYRL
ncbi:MAG TPA: SDR family oxidoreductase [Vicinamibacterales bacterium]|nr:SDR family oxidoreductase [Vicinamibacterales bacterium]